MESLELRMADYFFDTTVLVAYYKDEDPFTSQIIERVISGEASAAISAITVAELTSANELKDSALRSKRLAILELIDVIPVDRTIAERAGELRRQHNLALPDALIAACAVQVGGRFYSKDPHFNRLLTANVLSGEVYPTATDS